MTRRLFLPLLLVVGAAVAGCENGPPPPPAAGPPGVKVQPAVEQEVTDYEEFYGKTQAEKEVDVRARVSGYLKQINFTEGAEVRAGDVLFEIDPRPFQAEVDRTEANVGQAQAQVRLQEAQLKYQDELYNRNRRLYEKGQAVNLEDVQQSQAQRDTTAAQLEATRAALKSAQAARHTAQLNLDWCRVTAPIGGRISRRFVDPGNMVMADQTSLTRIESLDPIYAYFDVDERTYLRIKHFLEANPAGSSLLKRVRVAMGLSDGDEYPYAGTVDFVDNRVDPDSGSVWVRGTFPNAKRQIPPGVFARVRLPTGPPHRAVLIPEQALATDQGQKFVWVVDNENHARYRKVQVGAQHGQLRVVQKDVRPGERVIISGLQRVRNAPGKDYAEVNVLPDDADAAAKEQ